jgi:hypothetical protein
MALPGLREPAARGPVFTLQLTCPERPGPMDGHTGDARATRRHTSSRNTRPVRGRPWKAHGYADRTIGADAVIYMSVDPGT